MIIEIINIKLIEASKWFSIEKLWHLTKLTFGLCNYQFE